MKTRLAPVLILLALSGSARASDLAAELGSAESSARLDALTRAPESKNRATLLHLGMRSRPVRLQLVRDAKNFLFMTVPYWFNDEAGREFFSTVEGKRKADPSFDFRVLEDWTSPVSSGDPFGHIMFAWLKGLSDGNALLWNPLWDFRPWSGKIIRNRVHDKMFVVDGEKLIMGGMNVADDYLEGGMTAKGWHDTDILFEGPIARQAERDVLHPLLLQQYLNDRRNPFPEKTAHAALQDLFYFDPGENPAGTPVHVGMEALLENPRYFPPVAEPSDGVPVRLIYDNPLVDQVAGKSYSKVIDTFEFLASQAKERIRLFIAYPTVSAKMVSILTGAAKRGLDVEIVANSRQSTDMGAADYLAAMVSLRELVRAGVKIHEWQGHGQIEAFGKKQGCEPTGYWPGKTIHTKAIIVDGQVAMIGSHNLNVRSEEMNSEVMALVRDPGIAGELDAIFDYDLGVQTELSCGGKTFAVSFPRTLPLTEAAIDRLFKKEGAWLEVLHGLEPLM
jgi:phosphatidylserine/phosphatidylglycerophosphate/cardiolipin synthase-like enzyme